MRKICVQNSNITLFYASSNDIDLVYKMAMEIKDEDNLIQIFEDDFSYEDFREDSDECIFFTGIPNKNNYLLIEYDSQIIGTISHTFNDATIENMELDIWLRSKNYIGKELGAKSIQLLITYLHTTYNTTTFLIRPSKENARAIRAYSKCGFIHHENFALWGEGDFGAENTYSMVLQL